MIFNRNVHRQFCGYRIGNAVHTKYFRELNRKTKTTTTLAPTIKTTNICSEWKDEKPNKSHKINNEKFFGEFYVLVH